MRLHVQNIVMSSRHFFDPPWEQTNIALIDSGILQKAERMILSSEACNPDEAEIPSIGCWIE